MGKPGQGLKIDADLYCMSVDKSRTCFKLRLWSGNLASPGWLAEHTEFRELTHIERKAVRIDTNRKYWIQKLRFDTSEKRANFIDKLKEALAACREREGAMFSGDLIEITSQADWDATWRARFAHVGPIQARRTDATFAEKY